MLPSDKTRTGPRRGAVLGMTLALALAFAAAAALGLGAAPASARPQATARTGRTAAQPQPGLRFGQAVELRLPGRAIELPALNYYGLACVSAGNCVAGASYDDARGDVQAGLLTEAGGSWGPAVQVRLPAGAGRQPEATVNAVACPVAGGCVAVGGYETATGGYRAFIVAEAHGRWGRARQPLAPAGATAPKDVVLASIACTGPGSCEAVGSYTGKTGGSQAMAVRQSHGRWQRAVQILMPLGRAAYIDGIMNGVACPAAGECTAVGQYQLRDDMTIAAAATQARGRWHRAVQVSVPPNARAVQYASLYSVACPPGRCIATGAYLPGGSLLAMTATETGGRWGHGSRLQAAPHVPSTGVAVTGIACPGRRLCVAVGYDVLESGDTIPLAFRWNGHAWARIGAGTPPANALGADDGLTSVSCPAAGYCEAIGFYLDKSGRSEAFTVTAS